MVVEGVVHFAAVEALSWVVALRAEVVEFVVSLVFGLEKRVHIIRGVPVRGFKVRRWREGKVRGGRGGE